MSAFPCGLGVVFTELADALMTYLDEATERIIREEVFKDTEEPVVG